MTAVLGGHIDFMLGNPGEVLPQIEAGTSPDRGEHRRAPAIAV